MIGCLIEGARGYPFLLVCEISKPLGNLALQHHSTRLCNIINNGMMLQSQRSDFERGENLRLRSITALKVLCGVMNESDIVIQRTTL